MCQACAIDISLDQLPLLPYLTKIKNKTAQGLHGILFLTETLYIVGSGVIRFLAKNGLRYDFSIVFKEVWNNNKNINIYVENILAPDM